MDNDEVTRWHNNNAMHEATIAANILDIICERLASHPRTRARSITVLVGAFRGVEVESLIFAFDALKSMRNGCAECELIVESSSLQAKCAKHEHLYEPLPEHSYRCHCGSGMGEIIQGEELDVVGCTLQDMGNLLITAAE